MKEPNVEFVIKSSGHREENISESLVLKDQKVENDRKKIKSGIKKINGRKRKRSVITPQVQTLIQILTIPMQPTEKQDTTLKNVPENYPKNSVEDPKQQV